MPSLAVAIPTYNRIEVLLRCLAHLEKQTISGFEVILVDDGSTDTTRERIEQYRSATPLPLRYLYQQNSGPARARNMALDNAEAEVSVFIGDDIFATPTFLEEHVRFHQANAQENAIAIGLTRWCEEGQAVTKLMRWLDSEGLQFAFGGLLAGKKPGWQNFYTSNLSCKTSFLRKHRFDESFRTAAYEDLELALRLHHQNALSLQFLPTAIAEHFHPTDFQSTCKRMQMVGEGHFTFSELWPEHLRYRPMSARSRILYQCLTRPPYVLRVLSIATAAVSKVWCPNPLMTRVLELYGRRGYESASSKWKH